MAILSIITGAQRGRVYHLRPGTNRIGRSRDNDFQVPDTSVSGHHCELTRSETGILVRDLNSTNGTFVDGKVLPGDTSERLEQFLQIGTIQLELELERNGADAPVVRIPELPLLEKPVSSGKLPDGSPACANHPEGAATHQCRNCQQTLCDACVRVVGREGGNKLVFCTLCSAQCEPVLFVPAAGQRNKMFNWLTRRIKRVLRR